MRTHFPHRCSSHYSLTSPKAKALRLQQAHQGVIRISARLNGSGNADEIQICLQASDGLARL